MAEWRALKLRAFDGEDLAVLSSMLQDAIVPLNDVAFLKAERRFVMILNRFLWERSGPEASLAVTEAEEGSDAAFHEAEARPVNYRVNCALTFDRVRRAVFRGFDLADRRQLLNLLAIEAAGDHLLLRFSGGGAIRLDGSGILCHMEDIGEPWPTWAKPTHEGGTDSETAPG